MKRKKIAVLFGGRSGEHVVSLRSAASVIETLDPEIYEIIPIGITRAGGWIAGEDAWQSLWDQKPPRKATSACISLYPSAPGLMVLEENVPGKWRYQPLDVVFPVLHGPFGEDGTVQGLLELSGIAYVGSGVLASAMGMDKVVMKTVFRHHNIPVAPFLSYSRQQWDEAPEDCVNEVEQRLGFPCFIKPANLGSSLGISKVGTPTDIAAAVGDALLYDNKVIVEAFIEGREIECSVLGNMQPVSSRPGEIIPCNDFYDYHAKYLDDRSELVVPVELGEEIEAELKDLACRSFLAIEASGLARVDFFVNSATGKIVVNEINTMPGFTSISMFPKLWEASGVSYAELVRRLVELAEERHSMRHALLFSPPE